MGGPETALGEESAICHLQLRGERFREGSRLALQECFRPHIGQQTWQVPRRLYGVRRERRYLRSLEVDTDEGFSDNESTSASDAIIPPSMEYIGRREFGVILARDCCRNRYGPFSPDVFAMNESACF